MSFKEVILGDVAQYSKSKCSIEEISTLNYISTENMIPDKGGVIESSGLPNSKTVAQYRNNNILISNIRPYFKKIWYADKIGGASNDILIFDINKEIADTKFIYYTLTQDNFFDYMMKTSKGTKMPRGDKSAILNFNIKLPSLEEQKAIAKILSDLDRKIEINNKINKNLEEMAQAIFKQWFIDFHFPNEEGKPYKSSGGEMIESELGMIPKGWNVSSLDELCNVTIGKTPPRKEKEWFSTNEKDIKWVSIKDLGNSGVYIFNTSEFLTEEAVERFNVKRVKPNTVILSFKLTVGRIAITTEEMLTNEAIAHFEILESNKLTNEYLYSYLKMFNYETLGSTSSIATAVNSKIIRKIPILSPDENILETYTEYISKIFKLIRNNELQILKLQRLRDSLLPKLMSGEIRVNID